MYAYIDRKKKLPVTTLLRAIGYETDKDIRSKVQAAIRNGIRPVLCIGETAGERAIGETFDVLNDQLLTGLANVTSDELEQVVIAYEPVWAIGTGDNALPGDVLKAVTAIRRQLAHLYGAKVAEDVQVLYGGSVTASSAADYLAIEGVDGLLVGGASLKANEFATIAEKAYESTR